MYAGVAGLRTHQSKMDVIGNNVANVNTWSFKSYATNMTDVMYTTSAASTGGQMIDGGYGGMNPTQLGYGAKVSSVTPDLTKGAPAPSSNTLDNMIDGLGYYITGTLKKGGVALKDFETDAAKQGAMYKVDTDKNKNPRGIDNTAFEYSRVGAFSIDDNGYLVDNQRRYIYGFRCHQQVNSTGTGDPKPAVFRDGLQDNGGPVNEYLDEVGITPAYAHGAGSGRLDALCVPIDPESKTTPKERYKIESYRIDGNGTIIGYQKKTGKEITIGRVALATFENPQGLQKTVGSYWSYANNGNAGTCVIGKPTPSTGGTLTVGYLEMSNTDVAKEFSDMVTTQRGYQANSKIITVTDEMLETLINMKR